MAAADLLPAVLDPVIGALGAAGAPRVQRERGNVDHILVAPEMTRDRLIAWLFEGRAHPPPDRLRPDPVVGAASDPQRRFLFRPTPADVIALRRDFAQRWIDSGPGWFLQGALPAWVPADVRTQIGELDRAGALRRSVSPVVRTFRGAPPYGQIVLWYGAGDFLRFDELFCYQEFPEDLEFYSALTGVDDWEARLLHQVYTWFNRDLRLFVVERRMRPDLARQELQRIWGEVFRGVLEGASTILGSGTAISAINRLATLKDETVEAVLQSIRAKRRLFALWARNRSPWEIVLFRGTTLKRLLEGGKTGVLRDITLDFTHDLGFGTYFTPVKRIAEEFSEIRKSVPAAPRVIGLEAVRGAHSTTAP